MDDLEVHVPELSHVSAHHLVAVTEDDFAQVEGEQHVQEQDLVGPDQPLLVCLYRHWQHGRQGNGVEVWGFRLQDLTRFAILSRRRLAGDGAHCAT